MNLPTLYGSLDIVIILIKTFCQQNINEKYPAYSRTTYNEMIRNINSEIGTD